MNRFDLVIFGAGSTAFAAALRAQELGKTSVMIEERTLGGTCANRGCLPSKNLIEAARIVHEAQNPRYPGLVGAALGVDFATLVKQKDEIVQAYRERKYRSLLGGHISVVNGHAEFIDARTVEVSGSQLTGEAIIIATGSRPRIPRIRGLDRVPFLTSDLLTSGEGMELTELPSSLLIVGGGYIALELGQMFRRFGSEVTILERSDRLLPHGYEPELGSAIEEMFKREGVHVLTSSHIDAVRVDGNQVVATVVANGVQRELRAEKLLIAVGRQPNSDGIRVEQAGVELGTDGSIVVDANLRTNVKHIFAAGDVVGSSVGSQMATPVGSQDGGIAAQNALTGDPLRAVNHRVVPRAIFIDPPAAIVGINEAEAVAEGRACWCNTIPLSLVPRAGAVRESSGFVKMVADANTDEVLGVTMVGAGAPEVIHEAAMGLRFHAKLRDFIDLLHVYPTMAEGLKIVALSRFKDPARLSCCAE
ncbi:MAG: mercury(II) reductase [Planctomycetes bacterium]|nr:mercury(II) reductase [Nannocystis sp.]MBA3547004.1 mercury(II) reductase [Nannocystis sp.]MBA3845023.1 mercury(II) reductase [Planctomycetota bacterium]